MARAPRRSRGPATRSKVTVTIPNAVLEAALERVEGGQVASLSAYVSEALAAKVANDRGRDEYLEWLKQLDEELGPPSAEAYAWARDVLGR